MIISYLFTSIQGFPSGTSGKESACQCRSQGDLGLIPRSGRSSGVGSGNPLPQYSCLENPMDRGALWATVHEAIKSQTQLSTHTHTHTQIFISLSSDYSIFTFESHIIHWHLFLDSSCACSKFTVHTSCEIT